MFRTEKAPTTLGRAVITVAFSSAFLTLAACGSGSDDPVTETNQLAPEFTGTGETDNGGAGDGGATDGGATDGATGGDTDNGGAGDGSTDNGGAGDSTDNGGAGDGSDTGDNTDDGDGSADNGDTGTPEEGDIMMPMPGADASTVTMNCTLTTADGQTETVSTVIGFDSATGIFSVNSEPTAITQFTWSSSKMQWIGTADLVAGAESLYQPGHVTLDGVPTYYLSRLSMNGVMVEEMSCLQ